MNKRHFYFVRNPFRTKCLQSMNECLKINASLMWFRHEEKYDTSKKKKKKKPPHLKGWFFSFSNPKSIYFYQYPMSEQIRALFFGAANKKIRTTQLCSFPPFSGFNRTLKSRREEFGSTKELVKRSTNRSIIVPDPTQSRLEEDPTGNSTRQKQLEHMLLVL